MSNLFSCPAPNDCYKIEGGVIEIQNQHQTLTFDIKHGLWRKVTHKDGSINGVGEEIGSGGYLFKPNGDGHSLSLRQVGTW